MIVNILYEEIEYGGGVPSLFANIIWIIFFGIPMAIENFIFGCIWCITIVGIPFGLQFFKIAKLAGDAHWNPSECGLGDFTREQTKDLNDTNNPFEDPEVIELCNEYGRACLKSKTVPLLVLRDSNTGDILDLPYEKVRPFLNDPMVKLFLEHYYEI